MFDQAAPEPEAEEEAVSITSVLLQGVNSVLQVRPQPSSLLLSSLELSDTKVYEPEIRARLGTDVPPKLQTSDPTPQTLNPIP